MFDLLTFNQDHKDEEGTDDFSDAASNVFEDHGEVDFDNKILKDSSFVGTKMDCVLEELISTGNNLFKQTSEAFTGNNSKYNILFTTYNSTLNNHKNAQTPLPDSSGIIEIQFNLSSGIQNEDAVIIAETTLHETIHAELHRIKLSNNAGPNPLPSNRYKWYLDLWNALDAGESTFGASNAEHYFMAYFLINPIATGVREFDNNSHNIDNYKYFAWGGLEKFGKKGGYITQEELDDLQELSEIVLSDNNFSPCND